MDFFDVISKRKTIRKYKQEKPPVDDIRRIINSARLAPSATNSQNWKFIAIFNNEIKQKMSNAVEVAYDELLKLSNEEEYISKINTFKNYSVFFKDAPVVIACIETYRSSFLTDFLLNKGISYEEILLARPDSSLLSMGAAIENMILAATDLGYYACWMCAPIVAYKEFMNILNLDNSDKIVSLVTLGKPVDDTLSQPYKKPLAEILDILE